MSAAGMVATRETLGHRKSAGHGEKSVFSIVYFKIVLKQKGRGQNATPCFNLNATAL